MHAVFAFQTTSTKSPLPTAAHRLTSVTFNGKELVRYDYDDYGDLTAVYGRDGKNCTVSPTATTSWSITGTSATACTRFTRKFEKTVE